MHDGNMPTGSSMLLLSGSLPLIDATAEEETTA
jgi:hypothetical protein